MYGNFARCTTTTTGTGNLTLAAVTGYATFADVAAINKRVYYSIVLDSDGTPLEAGIGYLSGSTTFVREKILTTYVSSTFDESSPTAVSLASGTKRVIITSLAQGLMTPLPYMGSGAGYKGVSNALLTGPLAAGQYNDQDQSGRLNIFPWYQEYGGEVDAFIINCTAAGSAGQILRIGLYAIGSNGEPAGLIVESGSIAVDSTGVKTSTFTAFRLDPGHYFIACLSTSSTATYTGTLNNAAASLRGPSSIGNNMNDLAMGGYALSVATSAMPSTCPGIIWTGNLNVPHILLRAV